MNKNSDLEVFSRNFKNYCAQYSVECARHALHMSSVKKLTGWNIKQRFGRNQGWRQEFSDGGADSSDEEAKIWFSGYYKCQKISEKISSHLPTGASMLRRGAIAP